MFKLLFFIVFSVNCQEIKISNHSVFIRAGYSVPVFGHFGDRDSGFKPNFSFGIGYMRYYDEFLDFGLISDDNFYFRNRGVELKIKFFSFTPVIFVKPDIKSHSYIYVGGGIYHWTSPSSTSFISTSDDEFGVRFGYMRFLSLKKINIAGGFEWNYIIGVKGKSFDLGNVNILIFYLSSKIF